MPTNFEQDRLLMKNHWDNFISIIKNDLEQLEAEKTIKDIEIKQYVRIEKILEKSVNDPEYLLEHKWIIIKVLGDKKILNKDETIREAIEKNEKIFNAFKQKNNLNNSALINRFRSLFETIDEYIKVKRDIEEERNQLAIKIDKISGLKDGYSFDLDIVDEYSRKYNISEEAQVAFRFFACLRFAQKENKAPTKKQDKKETNKEKEENEIVETIPEIKNEENLSEDTIEEVEKVESKQEYKLIYNEILPEYTRITEEYKDLLNKYYMIITAMTRMEEQTYRIAALLGDEKPIDSDNYEALAKLKAIKIYGNKQGFDECFNKIKESNYTDKIEIDCLREYVREYETYLNELKELDDKIIKKEHDCNMTDSKVFFLTNGSNEIFIPEDIQKNYKGITNIMKKAEAGDIQKKVHSNIQPLKIKDKEYESRCGRSILSVRNYKTVVSYIKLNDGTGLNDGGIIIITAGTLNPNTIQDETKKIIKDNLDQLIKQIELIEKKDAQQLGIQKIIRDRFTDKEDSLEVEINDGNKSK